MNNKTIWLGCMFFVGFVGGIFGSLVSSYWHASPPQPVLKAHRYELLDDRGVPVAFWGKDRQGQWVLAFGAPSMLGSSSVLAEKVEYERSAIGLLPNEQPFLKFRGTDGRARARLYLDEFEQPLLLLDDQNGVRVSLGAVTQDTDRPSDAWALEFHPERAGIGMTLRQSGTAKSAYGFVYAQKKGIKFP